MLHLLDALDVAALVLLGQRAAVPDLDGGVDARGGEA